MATIPLFGLGVGRKSPNVSQQARINLYAEKLAEPDKAPTAYYTRPGHVLYDFGTAAPASYRSLFYGPMRGLISVTPPVSTATGSPSGPPPRTDILYGAAGQCVFFATAHANPFLLGSVPLISNNGPVIFADNGSQVIAVDGVSGVITFYQPTIDAVGTALTAVANFPQYARSVTFLAGRFFFDIPQNAGRFGWSALYDGTTINALDYATAETSPDPLVRVFEAHGQLLLFGTRTLEFWAVQPSGYNNAQPVTNVQGSTITWGCEAFASVLKVNDSVMFLGRNNNGDRKVLLLDGYKANAVSTPDVEWDINNDASPDSAVALAMTKAGHTFYILNLSNKSWAYDLTTGNWDIWMSGMGPNMGRYVGQYTAAAFGELIVSDCYDQRVYQLDATLLTENGNPITRELTSRHLFGPDLEFMPVSEIVVDMETGVGLTTGQGSAPVAMLQWSKNGGHDWGNEIWQSIGAIGAYFTRVAWRFLGVARDWTFRLRITDSVTTAIIGANMKVGK